MAYENSRIVSYYNQGISIETKRCGLVHESKKNQAEKQAVPRENDHQKFKSQSLS